MKKSFWNKRIPTLLGLLLILFGIVTTTFLTNKTQLIQTNASNSAQPKDVRITNITDTSFSVSYSTDQEVAGSINYGADKNLGQSALDDRDQKTSNIGNYHIHVITVKNLIPLTKYYFTILSGQQVYTTNDLPFEIITGPSLSSRKNPKSILKGNIKLLDATLPNEAIIYVTSDNSQVLSAPVDNNGNYQIDLSQTRNLDLSSSYNFNENSVIKILAFGNSSFSNAILYYSQLENVPLIILSKDYDFRSNNLREASPSANLESFPIFTSTSSASKKTPKILTPQKDQGFTDQQPLFRGNGIPNQTVQIIIHSNEKIQANVTADSAGNWNYRPSTTLSPGTHTITIVTKNAAGILETITQSFVVYASGNQIPNANGSPTPTPTPTSQLPQAPTPSIKTAISLTPTVIPAEIATNSSLTQTPTAIEKPLPPTGNPFIITAGIAGIFISLIGSLLFLLARKNI